MRQNEYLHYFFVWGDIVSFKISYVDIIEFWISIFSWNDAESLSFKPHKNFQKITHDRKDLYKSGDIIGFKYRLTFWVNSLQTCQIE